MENSYPVSEVIGYKIRKLRKEKGLSLLAVAQSVGISEQQQLRYERGNNRISIDRLKQYAIYFNINIDNFFLFSEQDKEKIKKKIKRAPNI
ncbi:helix-turn-helix domain-containing protein [Providencia sp. wls1914]|uniref:helix-turn-helix domain-containing protein n=1 Tax=Providencia sp. wls1914 TaxID=2675156 RepID=UPI0012B56F9E|nr:helix-turn-helix transcriptional regulator [Providencia sp. wls1914]MTC69582.1 helix-turn-helix domain-containing protein [Providencia sp. wls1914]